MGFPSLRALDKQLLVAAHPPEASALNRVSEEQVSGVSLGEKRKKERGICNQNFTAGIETKLQNHHPFFKVFPHRSTKTRMPKKLAVEKIKWQTPKKNSLPKIKSTKHPQHRQTHPKPQKKKGGGEEKKQTKNKTHTANFLLLFFRKLLLKSKPQREEKTAAKDKPKDTQQLRQELQLGALDL
jgi:predicted restriction endonuclease